MLRKDSRSEPVFMNPAIFISASVLLGVLFGLQEWYSLRHLGYHVSATIFLESWGFQFFLWGTISWLLWRLFGPQVQEAGVSTILAGFLPLSVLVSAAEEMIWVLAFPSLPLNHPGLPYWHRLSIYLYEELLNNVVIFWCAFFLIRGLGYYERYREQERTAAQLEIQLANARISALRMQLNPHFLFNTMNSISSLMRSDIDAADTMLEQLSCLMRITLERGEAQLIPLRDEMEFIELYLAMQAQRYAGRVEQSLYFDPELYDALVPAMLLQPVVENAYVHGLSKVEANGRLSIDVRKTGEQMKVAVLNSGQGLKGHESHSSNGHGVGLANVRSRLKLHYGELSSLSIEELERKQVQVTILLPLQYSRESPQSVTRYGEIWSER
jgi:two-component system, LytTR family, sensor kinase